MTITTRLFAGCCCCLTACLSGAGASDLWSTESTSTMPASANDAGANDRSEFDAEIGHGPADASERDCGQSTIDAPAMEASIPILCWSSSQCRAGESCCGQEDERGAYTSVRCVTGGCDPYSQRLFCDPNICGDCDSWGGSYCGASTEPETAGYWVCLLR